jgi:hypothetical protein
MIEAKGPRARVSRETRLLLVTLVVSLVALSLLARLRFPEQPVRVNPVPPLLTQFAAPRPFDDLAAEVARIEALVLPAVDVLALEPPEGASPARPSAVPAFRFRDLHVFALAAGSRINSSSHTVLGEDAGSGLVVLGRPPLPPAPFIPAWAAERTVQPRYLLAAAAAASGIALRPVFVGALQPIDSATWSASVWALETATALAPGMLLFTTSGAFAGVVTEENGGTILVPAPVVTAAAERLLDAAPRPPGTLGLEVQVMPPAFAASTGARGLVVSWVDPDGPAAGLVAATDIIEGIETAATLTIETWRVRRARIAAGDEISLRIRRDGVVHAVTVVAAEVESPPPAPTMLGLTLRLRARVGSEVVSTERESVAARAGLLPGDVITDAGSVSAPTPAAVATAFSALESGQILLTAVTRGDDHLILELVKP